MLSLKFDQMCQVLTYFISIGQNISQHLAYFISIGQNLHKLVNQRTLGVLTDTLSNKLTLRVSNNLVLLIIIEIGKDNDARQEEND